MIIHGWPKRKRNHPVRINRPPGLAWGDFIPANGLSRCWGCHFPWQPNGKREPKSVMYTKTHGVFVYCVTCWPKTTFLERVRAYEQYVIESARVSGQPKPDTTFVVRDGELVPSDDATDQWRKIYSALCKLERDRDDIESV